MCNQYRYLKFESMNLLILIEGKIIFYFSRKKSQKMDSVCIFIQTSWVSLMFTWYYCEILLFERLLKFINKNYWNKIKRNQISNCSGSNKFLKNIQFYFHSYLFKWLNLDQSSLANFQLLIGRLKSFYFILNLICLVFDWNNLYISAMYHENSHFHFTFFPFELY